MKKSLDWSLFEEYVGRINDLWETEAWQKVNHHDKTNGLSQKAVNSYRREHPGSKLKTAVTTKPSKLKAGSKAAKRRKSFCARMGGNKGPMKKPNGKPTPKALALRRWHCESIEEMAYMIARGEQMIAEMKQGVAEATGDERFDTIMGRMQKEPTIPDSQMPPTDVKDLHHWAVKHHKPYHKIFAKWANREGYKSVAPALQKAGNLDSDALDYWTPDVWKLWFGPGAEMPHHWSKERVPDELRDYLETVFDAYENIWQDWPTEYRQIGDRGVNEGWSQKYKSSINCSHPKGFSQKAHCAGKTKHNESHEVMEHVCPDCGMCESHGSLNEIKKGAKDSNGFTKCWPGKHAAGTKKGKNGGQVRNCVPNESMLPASAFVGSDKNKINGKGMLRKGPAKPGKLVGGG
jgi:Domain of unknown function (DUF6321)